MRIEKFVPSEDAVIDRLKGLPTEDIVSIFTKKTVPHSDILKLYSTYFVFERSRYLKVREWFCEEIKGTEISQNINTYGYMRIIATILSRYLEQQRGYRYEEEK